MASRSLSRILQFLRHTMRSSSIAVLFAAALIAAAFATESADADAVVAENIFSDAPPALSDENTLVETLPSSDKVSPQPPQASPQPPQAHWQSVTSQKVLAVEGQGPQNSDPSRD